MTRFKMTGRLCAAAMMLCASGSHIALGQARPALTQDVDQPGRNPFTLRADSTTDSLATFTVPAGKRYVIEQYTGDCAVVNSAYLLDLEIVTTSGGTLGFYHAPVHYSENIGFGLVSYAGTGTGPIYADPGTSITVLTKVSTHDSSNYRGCSFIVSGHVINNP